MMRRRFVALLVVLLARVAPNAHGASDAHEELDCERGSAEATTTVATSLNGVPALVRIPRRIERAPIILWHGFGPPASERALMEALPLDDVAAIKVYTGLPLFGQRAPEGGMQELARRQSQDVALQVFEPVVMGAANEIEQLVDALQAAGCMRVRAPIGLVGFSAGGAAVLVALAERRIPIDAAVTINASTGLSDSVEAYERATKQAYTWSTASRALAARSDAAVRAGEIAQGTPALLILHGKQDRVLAATRAGQLYDALRPLYVAARSPQRLRFDAVDVLAHGLGDAQALGYVRDSIASWFNRHGGPARSAMELPSGKASPSA